jgi:integrative and conjugative element protein (TIGR02256 family)
MATDLTGIAGIGFEEVLVTDLANYGLKALRDLASREDYQGCQFVSCHRSEDKETEAVVVEVYVELGQKPRKNDIRERERIAVVTGRTLEMPTVFPLRHDFPQRLPHMNLNYRDQRRSLCLFDANAEEIAHLYNPAMLVERVRWWMQKSAYGELHGTDQPLDPALAPSFWKLVLPPDFDATVEAPYLVMLNSEQMLAPYILLPWQRDLAAGTPQYACSHIVTGPVNHGAMVDLPANVGELLEIYEELDVDLVGEIKKLFDGDLSDPNLRNRLQQGLFLLITSPLIDEDGKTRGKTTRAFMSPSVTLLHIAKALGIASDDGGAIGRLVAVQPDKVALQSQEVVPLNVVDGFTPALAQASSGRDNSSQKNFTAIGLGALGSQAVLNLARMGQSRWKLIDNDFVAPHNLARHAALGNTIGFSKSMVVAHNINNLFQKEEAVPIHEAISEGKTPKAATEALEQTDRILDFSASVRAARWLACNERLTTSISSYFVNPRGTALVALHEGSDRQGRDGIVEMVYYALLTEDETLHEHLATSGQIQVGNCRDVSVTIPQSQMALFAALSAADIEATHELPNAYVKIWSLDADGSVTTKNHSAPTYPNAKLNGWTIAVSPSVIATIKEARGDGNVETGGILLGGFDLERRRLVVTKAVSSPADSIAGRTYYERGTHGVKEAIERTERITMRHITYVGEWHTHPIGSTSDESDLDRTLLSWVADLRQLFLMPGLLLILGDDGLRAVIQEGSRSDSTVL